MNGLRVTPLGTCRIHTALKRGSLRYPIELDLGRNYGFVHTASEALQLLRFMNGEQDIPEALAALIVSGGDIATYAAQSWSPADLHVVEISSAKKLMSGEHVVQLNQVQHHYADFFADRERSRRFWNLVKAGNRVELVEYARQAPAFRLLSREERDLLLGITFEQQSFKSIKAEMAEIVERLGADAVMFVTHVNARGPSDEIIASRDRLIRWVKLGAEQLGVKVFDPTAAMQDFGQDRALESGGLDLTHYTPAFSDRVCDDLYTFHVGGLVGSIADCGVEDAADAVAAHLGTALMSGDFFDTSRRIHAELERSPGSDALIELRGLVSARIGDFARAVQDLGERDDRALSLPARTSLVEALTALGRFDQSLAVATNLVRDEYEDPDVFGYASEAAERLGRRGEAIRWAKQAYRLNRSDLSACFRVLRLLSERSSPEEIAHWRDEVLANLGSASSGALELCQWAVEYRDEQIFAAAIGAVGEKGTTIELVEEAFEAGLFGAVADSVSALVALSRLAPPLAKRRSALIEAILDKSVELFESGRGSSAYRCSKALAALADTPADQLRTARVAALADRHMHAWMRDLRKDVREAEGRGPEAVIDVSRRGGDLVKADAPIIVAVARALDSMGRSGEALALLSRAEPEVKADMLYRRSAGRIALHAEDYRAAIDTYGALRKDEAVPADLRAEAERILDSIGGRAAARLRELVLAEQYEQALALAGTIERHTDQRERVQRELTRMYRKLRTAVREIENGDADEDELERFLRLIASIRPDDQPMLRRLALELMRQLRFAEAAEVWESMDELAPGNDSVVRALRRCQMLARRRSGLPVTAAA